jgi:tRNA(fMet)-specific endonuclease VapC
MYLLDTDTCIFLIKQKSEILLNKLKSHPVSVIKISSVTIAELYYGVAKSQRRLINEEALLKFLSPFEFVPFTEDDGVEYGKIRATLESEGQIIGPYDLQLAAQAKSRNLILVSNNEKEFRRVSGLAVENWSK